MRRIFADFKIEEDVIITSENPQHIELLPKDGVSQQWIYTGVIILLLLSVAIRSIYLHGDAPVGDISRSGVFYVDEGTYAHNVVNKILYDSWFMEDDYNAMSNVPIFSMFQYLLLSILGLGLKSLRATGIIYMFCSLLLLWIFLKRSDIWQAFLFLLLGSLNFFLIIYNRLALLENLLILFLIMISVCLYYYRRQRSVKWLFAAIFIFWAGFFIKATILFFLPMIMFIIITNPVSKRIRVRHFFYYALFSTILLLTAYFLWVRPHNIDWHYFESRNIHQNIDESSLIFITNYARYFTNLKIFQFMPVTYLIFLVAILYYLYELVLRKRISYFDQFFTGWAVCAFAFLGFFKYSPPRHSLILMVPLLVLVSSFLIKLYRRELDFEDKNTNFILIPVCLLALAQIGFGFYRVVEYDQHYLSCYLPLLSVVIIPFIFVMLRKKINYRTAVTILLSVILLVNTVQIVHYYTTIQFSYFNAMQDMKKIIDEENLEREILVGDIAPLLAVELKTRAVNIIFRKDTEHKRILNNRPNILVLQENQELDRLARKLPYYFDEIELLRSYKIFNNYRNDDDTYVYRIVNRFDNFTLNENNDIIQ